MSESASPSAPGRQAARGGVLVIAERVVSQLSQLAVFIVAARVLGPAEFGVFALVSAVAVVLLRVAELGWAPFIMSWRGDERVPRQVMTLAALSGAAVGAVALAATGLAYRLGASPEIAALSALFSLWVALGPLAGALSGLMIRRGQIGRASLCETAGEIAALVVSVAALLGGEGLLSLAYGRLAFIAVRLGLSVLLTRTMPMTLREAPLREIGRFSTTVLATRVILQVRGHVGTFLVGAFLGPVAVGHYRAAERLAGALSEIMGVPVERLAWSYLREARDDPAGGIPSPLWSERAHAFFRAVMIVSVPAFAWLIVMSDDIVVGLLGPEWRPAAAAAALIALGRMLMLYGSATEPVLALAGKVSRMPRAMMLFLLSAVALTLGSAPFGLLAVSAAQIAIGGIVLVVTLRLFARHAHVGYAATLGGAPAVLAAAAAAALAALALRVVGPWADWQPLLRAFAVGLMVLPVYAAVLLALDRGLRSAAAAGVRARP